jgi:hypothetical protein
MIGKHFGQIGSFAFAVAGLAGCTSVSPNEQQWQRARTACQQVGLEPESPEVAVCAGKIQMSLNSGNQ